MMRNRSKCLPLACRRTQKYELKRSETGNFVANTVDVNDVNSVEKKRSYEKLKLENEWISSGCLGVNWKYSNSTEAQLNKDFFLMKG